MKRSRRHPRSRAGLTFLEVVVSIAILGGISSVVFGTIAFVERAAVYDTHRLNAMEVAHRTVVQWIDDPEWIRNQPKRYEYLGRVYLFDVSELMLISDDENGMGGRSKARAVVESDVDITDFAQSALRVLEIRVWLEEEGREGVPTEAEPLVHMTRTYWLGATKRGQEEMFKKMLEMMGENRPSANGG